MMKLVCLAFSPLVAAVFFAEQAPEFEPADAVPAEIEDRQFLADLAARVAVNAGRLERADQEFLAKLEAQAPAPVAVAVQPAGEIEPEMTVRRAIAVRPAEPVRVAEVRPETSITRVRQALEKPALNQIAPVVRRAVPVAGGGRASIVIYGDEVVIVPTASLP